MIRSQRHASKRQFPPIHAAAFLLAAFAAISTIANGEKAPQLQPGSHSESENSRLGLLQPFNSVVGSWRGTGQPKRGSARGAWLEKTVCRWDFSAEQPAVRFDAEKGRQFERMTMTVAADTRQLVLRQRIDETSTRTYYGKTPTKWPTKLKLITAPDDDGSSYRCTIEQLSDIRLVMLFERRATANGRYRRVAGIGYTRAGYKLAQGAGNQRECIVTGGQGTIPVTHKGKTWYVCCEGCRQAFEDAPDEIIADYTARKKQTAPTR